jgi:hypothetical protein
VGSRAAVFDAPVRRLLLGLLLSFGCEKDALFVDETPPDSGVHPDAEVEPTDAGFVDVGFVDASTPVTDAGVPPADEPVYIQTGTTLYSYDPSINQAVRVGDFRDQSGVIDLMVDIAIDRNGTMYGGVSEHVGNGVFENRIYLVNPETAFCTFLYDFDDRLNGMSFLDDGRLVIAGERVTVIDPNSGQALVTWPSTDQYVTSGDVVGLPDGNLYWTVKGENDGDADRVVRIDPSTGSTAVIGDASVESIFGLGYAEGILYGFTSRGQVVTLDPTSGAVLALRDLSGRWYGATTNPVLWD